MFNLFLTDNYEVREGVLLSMPEWIKGMPEDKRNETALKLESEILKKEPSWRRRVEKCKMLKDLACSISSSVFC